MKSRICIIGAIREEVAEIKNRMKMEESHVLESGKLWLGTWEKKSIALLQTGVGRERAEKAFLGMLDRVDPALVISMGYAGGVDPLLNVGDIVLADRVLEFAPHAERDYLNTQPTVEIDLNSEYLELGSELAFSDGFLVETGGLLTVEEIIYQPKEKRALGIHYPVLAVEMETAALAKLCGSRGIPLVSIRSVTDTVNHELIRIPALEDKSGEASRVKATWYVLTHPVALKPMIELMIHSRTATAHLTKFIGKYIRYLE